MRNESTIRFFRIFGFTCIFTLIINSHAYSIPNAITDVTVNDSRNGYQNIHNEGVPSSSANLSTSLGKAKAEVDLAAGTVKTYVDTSTSAVVPDRGADVNAYGNLVDSFTLHGLPPGEIVWLPASLHVTGTYSCPPGASANWWSGFSARISVIASASDSETLYPSDGGQRAYDNMLTAVSPVLPGTPFSVSVELSSYGHGWDGNNITSDFFNTARLRFNLPTRTWITSEGGFYQKAAQVPLPAILLLLF